MAGLVLATHVFFFTVALPTVDGRDSRAMTEEGHV
jgi:hypothetical protein